MRPEIRAEYTRALGAVVIRNGDVLKVNPTSQFMLYDRMIRHELDCIATAREVQEDAWYEFQGTFAKDHTVHGVTATGVTCTCGALQDRIVRWQASPSTVAEEVFEEAFGGRSKNDDDVQDSR